MADGQFFSDIFYIVNTHSLPHIYINNYIVHVYSVLFRLKQVVHFQQSLIHHFQIS